MSTVCSVCETDLSSENSIERNGDYFHYGCCSITRSRSFAMSTVCSVCETDLSSENSIERNGDYFHYGCCSITRSRSFVMSTVCGVCETDLSSENSIERNGDYFHYGCCSITRSRSFVMSTVCGVCETDLSSENSIERNGDYFHYGCCSITRSRSFLMSTVCGVCETDLSSDNSIERNGDYFHYGCCSITRSRSCEMKENPLSKRLHPIYKDVVVIGNGPSGLSMSYVLAGHSLTYNGRQHPDAMLDAALRTTLQKNAAITDSDLSSLAQCVEGRGSSTPLGVLLDHLVHPGADSGSRLPPLVDWVDHPAKALSHVVIGKGPPGGTWTKMDGRTMTLSLSSWMELPGLPLHESDVGKRERVSADGSRVATSTIAEYYQEYVHKMGLEKYQRRGVVTSVAEYDDADDAGNNKKINWVIEGRDHHGRKFRYLSKFVVLGCGTTDSPNRLRIPGEGLPWVHHSTRDLDEFLRGQPPSEEDGPVLVVGSGLSACDGVLCAKSHGVTAYHLYRGKQGLSRWLPLTAYPEYLLVHQLMTGAATCPTYKGTSALRLSRCQSGAKGRRSVTLESDGGDTEVVDVSAVAILVGSTADLSFLPRDDLGLRKGPVDARGNPLDISLTTYQLNRLPNCYAIGPLAGDMFVRHILGGVVASAAHILKTV